MTPQREQLEELLRRLGPERWPRRFHHEYDRRGRSVTLTSGGRQIVVRAVEDGSFEILYERALHDATRQRRDLDGAVHLLEALLNRED
jgi:hypothetical protein